jgi:hypothetical protein
LTAPIQGEGKGVGSQTGEDGILVAIVFVVRKGSGRELEVGVGVVGQSVAGVHLGEFRGFIDRERMEENGVDDGENGGVGADAEAEREDGDGGEAGAFEEVAESAANILTKILKHSRLPRL